MKHTLLNMYKKHWLPILLLICLGILIWINGPLLKIGNSIPLADPLKRTCLIILTVLAWLLKCIFIDYAPQNTQDIPSPDTQKKLHYLQGRFYGALAFLKKTVIEKYGKPFPLDRLPWYLFIGPANAGKTTLLANANIHYLLAKQRKVEPTLAVTPSDNCDWWVTRDAVFVDVPGAFLTARQKEPAAFSPSLFLWRHLLSLLQKIHKKNQLHGIILALHLPEIMQYDETHKNQLMYDIKKRITEIMNQFGTLPIHLMITKCDLLPGFGEFFSDCSSDEIAQIWGIPLEHHHDNRLAAFSQRFNALIKRINKQLISRLHQERNPLARSYIKDFPLHLEKLKETLAHLLKTLTMPNLSLQGIYLTSSTQDYQEEESGYVAAAGVPTHFHTQSLQIMSSPPLPARSYFVKHFLSYHLIKSTSQMETAAKRPRRWRQRLVFATCASAVMVAAFFLGKDFKFSVQEAYSIQNDLNHYQLSIQPSNQPVNRLLNALPLLNALQQAATHSTGKLSLAYYSRKSQQTANGVYQQALQTIVLPDVKGFFEAYLQTASTKNPDNVYAILKAYLMLNDKTHFQADYVAKSLQQVVPQAAAKPAVIMALVHHIQAALNGSQQPIPLNKTLITQTRKIFTNLPSTTLGFVILKNMENNNMDSPIGLGTHLNGPPVFVAKSVETIIPKMYTADYFEKIITQESRIAATEATQGNWVLGMNFVVTSQAAAHALAAQLRTQYIANYVDIWESLLANIQLAAPRNLVEMNALVGTLTGDHSPLLQLLDTIRENTSFAPVMAASPKLQSLSVLLVDANHREASALYQIFTSLKTLHEFLQPMVNAKDPGKAAFEASAQRMQNGSETHPLTQLEVIAEQSPEPMKTWLNAIAQQTWRFLLQASAQYIDGAWQTEIMPVYHAEIANRYPFNQTAVQEVGLAQFTAFLGQQGLMARFYQQYLKPFVEESETGSQWRVVDHEKIPFSENALVQLGHAASLQRVFFPNGDNKLYVQFALQPVSLDSMTKRFGLSVNGQQVSYQKDMAPSSQVLAWPGNNGIAEADYHFWGVNNQLTSGGVKGEWGWFRVVTEATKSVHSRKEIALRFSQGGRAADYLLFTQGHMNPFLPLNLSRLELPERLG